MITYGYSIQGKSHIQRGVVCQDSSKVQRLRANVYMGIVADGVGSAVHSDIGSKMAWMLYLHFVMNISKEAIL